MVTNVAKIVPIQNQTPIITPQVIIPNPFLPPGTASLTAGTVPPPPPQTEDSGPATKRFRPEESLESEEEWLKKVSGQITLNITTPQTQEWNLEGKIFKVTLDITSMVIFFIFLLNILGYCFKSISSRGN